MSARLRASVVVIGDEILGGFVQDSNSGWLAVRLQQAGVPLERIVTVPDELDDIAEALTTELERPRPRIVFTSGGIGSTPDDVTLEAVARTLGRELESHPTIEERIEQAVAWARGRGGDVDAAQTKALRKMAMVPEGTYLVATTRGITPGVAVDLDGGCHTPSGATIVVLPGIPSELQRIVRDGVEPALLDGHGMPEYVEELTHDYPESAVTPVLDRLVEEFPEVHVGSYPGPQCTVRFKGPEAQVAEARKVVEAYLDDLGANPEAQRLRAAWRPRWRDDS